MKLNPSRLKIDLALVTPLIEAAEQRKLIGYRSSLDIEVVTESVKTIHHAIFCAISAVIRCKAFARPMTKADLATFIRSGSWRRPETSDEPVHTMVLSGRKA